MEERNYSGYDALRIALEMERRGSNFYKSLADKVSHKSLKDVFRQLAREEEHHIKTMEDKLLPLCQSEEAYWADEELMVAHLKRLMAGGVFQEEKEALKRLEGSTNELEAIYLAIQAEKDSLELYKKAGQATSSEEGKKAFALLTEEEERHLQLLYHWQRELTEHG